MRVPKNLQRIVGKNELRYNLYTGSLRQAKRKSKRVSRKVKGLFEELREGKYRMTDSALTKARLDRMMREFVKGAIELNEHERATSRVPFNSDSVDEELEKLEFAEDEFREALAYRDYRLIHGPAKSFIKSHSLNVSEDSDDFLRVCHELMKAQIFLYQIERKQAVGDYSYQNDYLAPLALPQEPEERTSEPLSSIVESFWNEKAGDWKARSQTQYKGVQTWLLDTLGRDTPIHTVDYQTGRDVKEALMAKKNQAGRPLSKDRVNLYLNHISAN
jgi:hypothetical protein